MSALAANILFIYLPTLYLIALYMPQAITQLSLMPASDGITGFMVHIIVPIGLILCFLFPFTYGLTHNLPFKWLIPNYLRITPKQTSLQSQTVASDSQVSNNK